MLTVILYILLAIYTMWGLVGMYQFLIKTQKIPANYQIDIYTSDQVLIAQLTSLRKSRHLSIEELAKKAHTNPGYIRQLEEYGYLRSIDFLRSVASALGKEVQIDLIDRIE